MPTSLRSIRPPFYPSSPFSDSATPPPSADRVFVSIGNLSPSIHLCQSRETLTRRSVRKKGKGNLFFQNPSFLPKMQKLFRGHEIDYEVRLCKNCEASYAVLGRGHPCVYPSQTRCERAPRQSRPGAHLAPVRVRPKATLVRHKRPTQSFVRLSALADRVATRLKWDAAFIECR